VTETDARDILQVTRDASPADIRRAYLDLVKVWHPDRFLSDARLRDKAQRTLQQINEAYALLGNGTPGAAPAPPICGPEPGPATGPRAAESGWQPLPSSMALPVCVGLALGVALSLTLILRSAPEPTVVPPESAMQPSTPSQATPEAAAPMSPRRPRPAQGPPRPDTGTEVGRRGPAGRGALTIRSGLATDGVVELIHEAGHRRRLYLRRGEQITLLDLVPGSYQLRFAAGTGWTGRWFDETSATVERVEPVTVAQSVPGARVEAVTLVFGDPDLRSTSLLQPD
jgi:hypothetical protein